MLGTGHLASLQGLARPWIFLKNLLLSVYKARIIPLYIFTSCQLSWSVLLPDMFSFIFALVPPPLSLYSVLNILHILNTEPNF